MKGRRGAEKTRHELEDIIRVFQEMELNDPTVFVARNLADLPSLALNDSDTFKLVRDMESMKSDLKALTLVHSDLLQVVKEKDAKKRDEANVRDIDTMKSEIKALASAQADLTRVVKENIAMHKVVEKSGETRIDGSYVNSSVKDVSVPAIPVEQEKGPNGAIVTTKINEIRQTIESAVDQNNDETSVQSSDTDEDLSDSTDEENKDNTIAAIPTTKPYWTNDRVLARTFTNRTAKNQASDNVGRYSGSINTNNQPFKHHRRSFPRKPEQEPVSIGYYPSQTSKAAPLHENGVSSPRTKHHSQYVPHKKTQEKVLIGSGPSRTIRVASTHENVTTPTRNRTCTGVFVSRLEPRHTANQIEKFVWNQSGCRVKPEKLPSRYGTYSSFYIPCDKRIREALLDCSIWPAGTLLKLYYI